jgi:hypothetical protein
MIPQEQLLPPFPTNGAAFTGPAALRDIHNPRLERSLGSSVYF